MAKKKVAKKGVKNMDKQKVIDAMEEILSSIGGCVRYRGFADRVYNDRFPGEDFNEFCGYYNEIVTESLDDETGNEKFQVMLAAGRRWLCLVD